MSEQFANSFRNLQFRYLPVAILLISFGIYFAACSSSEPEATSTQETETVEPSATSTSTTTPSTQVSVDPTSNSATRTFEVDIWVDNWFIAYVDGAEVGEDSVPITTERSFNKESFTFTATYPFMFSVITKDFKENDTGLEYIGSNNQQMGDGGFIAQIRDISTGEIVAVTDSSWRGLVTHEAPLDKSCEKDSNPSQTCEFQTTDEPSGWQQASFNDDGWLNAIEYSESDVSPKDGYDEVSWDSSASLIWATDLETDNTILWRKLVSGE